MKDPLVKNEARYMIVDLDNRVVHSNMALDDVEAYRRQNLHPPESLEHALEVRQRLYLCRLLRL